MAKAFLLLPWVKYWKSTDLPKERRGSEKSASLAGFAYSKWYSGHSYILQQQFRVADSDAVTIRHHYYTYLHVCVYVWTHRCAMAGMYVEVRGSEVIFVFLFLFSFLPPSSPRQGFSV